MTSTNTGSGLLSDKHKLKFLNLDPLPIYGAGLQHDTCIRSRSVLVQLVDSYCITNRYFSQ